MTAPSADSGKTITAYKAFDSEWSCRGFKYEVGKTYKHDGEVSMCNSGFHACTVPFDCWFYYEGSRNFASVELSGVSTETTEDSKRVGASITITAQITLPEWITAQAQAVIELCKAAKKSLVSKREECAAATGNSGHAAATGYSGHAAATGYRGHAAATGNSGHAAATGNSGHAAATGDRGHAAATGNSGHAAVEGKHSIAAALGYASTAKAEGGGAIVLASYNDDFELVAVRASLVGENGVHPGKTYRLTNDGEFQEVVK